MGFTYTDKNLKTVLHSWGRFRVTLLEAVQPGDLLSFYNTDNAYTVQFADQSDSQAAQAVACEEGAAGEEIWAALAVELKSGDTPGTGGVVTRNYFAAAADFFGAPLYLGEDGKPSSSAGGTYSQLVGYLLARDRIILQPNTALTGVAGSFTTLAASGAFTSTDDTDASSPTTGAMKTAGGMGIAKKLFVGTDFDVAGNAVIDGTLTQTGVATFAAEDVHTLGINIATLKTLRMPATDYAANGAITPKGFATMSKATAAAMTLAAGTPGDIVGIYAKTAQAHVVTAGAGITFNGTNNTATYGGAINDGMLLLCISATLWVVLAETNVTMSTV